MQALATTAAARKLCRICGLKWARSNDTRCWKCASPSRVNNRSRKHRTIPSVRARLDTLTCEFCSLVVVDRRLLEVDHINGDHYDDRPENLQILCCNCHRLKSIVSGDYRRRQEG